MLKYHEQHNIEKVKLTALTCCILGKSRKKLVNIQQHFRKILEILQNAVKNQQKFQQFLTKKFILENGAKECIA